MSIEELNRKDIILVSHSPRRRQLLGELGLRFRVAESHCEEVVPAGTVGEEIPLFLSNLKAEHCPEPLGADTLIIAADTIVWADNKALGKPHDKAEAFAMLQTLSGRTHEVMTGVTLKTQKKKKSFVSITEVTFAELEPAEINYYIEHYQPFDKAGAYGIQEWVGLMGVTGIKGCFYNVMGLPVPELYRQIKSMIEL